MINEHIISMPDKWEYPWFAAWDLAFHTIALATVDIDFAKQQLDLLLQSSSTCIRPDRSPPTNGTSATSIRRCMPGPRSFCYRTEQALGRRADLDFLKRVFAKLSLNFSWWVNRKDRFGKNLFEGGFLGLDNIGVFDRSAPLPTGGYLEQADGTAWMALFCQNMLEIGVELAAHDPTYEDLAASSSSSSSGSRRAMNGIGSGWHVGRGGWVLLRRASPSRRKRDAAQGPLDGGSAAALRHHGHRAVAAGARAASSTQTCMERLRRMPELLDSIHPTGPGHLGVGERGILALVNQDRLRRILSRMLDENEFLSPHGIRALSRYHAEHPYVFSVQGQEYRVNYLPAESDSGMFGGNSNWRGPVWMPVNALLIRALMQYYLYYGDSFKIECPTGSGNWMNLFEVAARLPIG